MKAIERTRDDKSLQTLQGVFENEYGIDSNPQDIPERFSVLFKGDDTPLLCYVVWRKADRIGVAFE